MNELSLKQMSETPVQRIHHPSKWTTHLTLWLGLVGALAVAAGFFLFGHKQAEKKRAGTFNYLKPVASESQLRAQLTEEQYRVTREGGTETAFRNDYWDNFKPGIYIDVITGEPLFSSTDKFDSGTGRPSFTKPISADLIYEQTDTSFNMQRTEVRATRSNSHLGHVFNDGPPPTGRRYAVSSAALRFVPLEEMQAKGYTDFLALFPNSQSPTPGAESK
jgi:peptide-methionine (R)-S-oxide reductase